jgi:hypothetical protein
MFIRADTCLLLDCPQWYGTVCLLLFWLQNWTWRVGSANKHAKSRLRVDNPSPRLQYVLCSSSLFFGYLLYKSERLIQTRRASLLGDKMCDFIHDSTESRLVAGGHLTDTPIDSVYSSVVSLRGIRMLTYIAEHNGHTQIKFPAGRQCS